MALEALHTAKELGEFLIRLVKHAVAGQSPVQVAIPLIRKAIEGNVIVALSRDVRGKLLNAEGKLLEDGESPVARPLNAVHPNASEGKTAWRGFFRSGELALEVLDFYNGLIAQAGLLDGVEKDKKGQIDHEVRNVIAAACHAIAKSVDLERDSSTAAPSFKLESITAQDLAVRLLAIRDLEFVDAVFTAAHEIVANSAKAKEPEAVAA